MKRVPEPELMDDDAQARAYAEAGFEEPHRQFVELFRAQWPVLSLQGRVLDLGCGPADITLRFARAWPGTVIDGIDGAEAMLGYGRERIRRHGLEGRIRLWRARLPDDPLPGHGYDAVISNSLLHHLRDPAVLWEAVKAAARPGAPVFVMDLMRPGSEAQARALVEEHAAGEPEVLRRDFYHSLLAAYRVGEVRDQLAAAGLAGLSVRAVSDRHLVVAGVVGE